MKQKKKAIFTALGGTTVALSTVLMMITVILPVLMYIVPILTGLLVLYMSDLAGKKWGIGVFFATAVISLLLVSEKDAALSYTLIFGYYGLIKDAIEKLPKALSWTVKILLYNVSAVSIGVLGIVLFGFNAGEYTELGKFTVPILLLMANAALILYDLALTKYRLFIKALAEKTKKKLLI
ncbi:MAG: hypothetical protein KIG53_06705 [Oscillospiraceae bacterium]|nr:hypothetical protein [Oscillospiraceae bacterium]